MNKVCKLNRIIGGYLFLLLLLGFQGRAGWAQEQTQREAFRSRLLKVFQEAQREAEKSDIASIVEDAKYKVSKVLNGGSPIFKLKTRCNLISTRREGDQNDCFQSIDQGPPAGSVVTVAGPPPPPPPPGGGPPCGDPPCGPPPGKGGPPPGKGGPPPGKGKP